MTYSTIYQRLPASIQSQLDALMGSVNAKNSDDIRAFIAFIIEADAPLPTLSANMCQLLDWLSKKESLQLIASEPNANHPLSRAFGHYQQFLNENRGYGFTQIINRALPHVSELIERLGKHLSDEMILRFQIEIIVKYKEQLDASEHRSLSRKELSELIIHSLHSKEGKLDWDNAFQQLQDPAYPQSMSSFLSSYLPSASYDIASPIHLKKTPVYFAHCNPEVLDSPHVRLRKIFPYHGFVVIGESGHKGVVLRRLATDVMLAPFDVNDKLINAAQSVTSEAVITVLTKLNGQHYRSIENFLRGFNQTFWDEFGKEAFLKWYYDDPQYDHGQTEHLDKDTIILSLSKSPNTLQNTLIKLNKKINGHLGAKAPLSIDAPQSHRDRRAFEMGYSTALPVDVSSIAVLETDRRLRVFKEYVDQVAGIGQATDVEDSLGRRLVGDVDEDTTPSANFIDKVLASQWIRHVKIWFRSGRGDGLTTNCNKAAASFLQASMNVALGMPYAHFQTISTGNKCEFGSNARMRIHDPLLFGRMKSYLVHQIECIDTINHLEQTRLLRQLKSADNWEKLEAALTTTKTNLGGDKVSYALQCFFTPKSSFKLLKTVKRMLSLLLTVRTGETALTFLEPACENLQVRAP